MRKATLFATCLLLLGIASLQNAAAQSAVPPGAAIVEFKTMVGVSGPFLGASNPIRGVPGGHPSALKIPVDSSASLL